MGHIWKNFLKEGRISCIYTFLNYDQDDHMLFIMLATFCDSVIYTK